MGKRSVGFVSALRSCGFTASKFGSLGSARLFLAEAEVEKFAVQRAATARTTQVTRELRKPISGDLTNNGPPGQVFRRTLLSASPSGMKASSPARIQLLGRACERPRGGIIFAPSG